jgi:hypothetical protein
MSQTSINVPTPRRVDLEQETLSITTTDADLTPVYASLTTNLGLIGDNTNSITSLRNDLTSNVASITGLSGSITQVATDLSNNVLSISSLTGSISTINGSLTAHQASLSSHALTLTAHENSINTLSGSTSALSGSVSALTGSVSSQESSITTLIGSVSAHESSISALTGSVSGLSGSVASNTDRLDNLSYTDISGTLPNEDVAEKGLTANKMEYDTGAKVPIGGSSYPSDSVGLELDYQNRNWYDLISGTYALASMAGALNTLIGDPLSITSIAAIQAEQIIQNERLFDLDAPTTGRVAVNEDAISTLSSSVATLETRTTDWIVLERSQLSRVISLLQGAS